MDCLIAGIAVPSATESLARAGFAARANGPRSFATRLSDGAAAVSCWSSGAPWVATASSCVSDGLVAASSAGSRAIDCERALPCAAVVLDSTAARSRNRCRSALPAAPVVTSLSLESISVWSCALCRVRIEIASRAVRRVGLARSSTWFRSWPRPAVAIPSSSMITDIRSRVGRLKVLNRSSRLTGSVVLATGTVGG